ncbi:MAG: type IV toxin-antitoxin system AbiEi family antitoxin domain-containing protein [Gordonia sp. (in: high G+C Gram-positive bacteria)]|uniref:type IV toxin-antitoxin system AbiEi family antitoxin domain-containing protein n=1 Tax=Gordonia sp. (in: high G+C Gram-positive bacteria) TaxID=84139 RepID=UPI0039E59775
MDLNEFLARHDGVITRRQAVEHGLSQSAITRRIGSGQWHPVARGVYLAAGHPRGDAAQARLAVHSVGPGAVLGGAAAAWWLGLLDEAPRRHLVLTAHNGEHRRTTSTTRVVHRTLAPSDTTIYRGLALTKPELTVLDASLEVGIGILDRALLRRSVTLPALVAANGRYPGRPGIARVNKYLALLGSGARSEMERRAVHLFRRSGVTGWIANFRAAGYTIDFAFPDAMLAVEFDGFAFHRDAATFQRDRTRRNALIAAGWTVLNFTWGDVVDRPDQIVGQIRSALRVAA